MNQTDLRTQNRTRIQQLAGKALDALDLVLDQMKPPAPPALSATVTRRQVANTLRVAQFCAHAKCRRSSSCRGEPADCLRTVLPLMPDAMVGLLKMRRKRG